MFSRVHEAEGAGWGGGAEGEELEEGGDCGVGWEGERDGWMGGRRLAGCKRGLGG